jgi:four helix bundle protein
MTVITRSEPAFAPVGLDGDGPRLDPERLVVYQVALEFQVLASQLVPRGHADLRSQFDRASVSIALNLAEGAGRRLPLDKARFYTIARGSATECGAILDVLRVRGLADEVACRRGRALIVRIVQMVTKLEAATVARARSPRQPPR